MAIPRDAAAPAATPAETPAAGRIHVLDILRGFALLGMIVVHFHQKMELPMPGLEDLIGWVTYVGIETKAWGTFAFLFGVGFAILLRRFEARGVPVVTTYLRRLLGLAVFGLIAWVFFGFTILLDYAFWGVPLLLIRRWSTRTLLATAVLALMFMPALAAVRAGIAAATPPASVVEESSADGARPDAMQALRAAEEGDDYGALVRARAAALMPKYGRPGAYLPGSNLALFILGLLALRHGIFDAPRRHVRLIAGAMAVGFVSWGLAWLAPLLLPALPSTAATMAVRSGLGLFNDQLLCLTYIGGLLLLVTFRPVWLERLSPFGLAGRMALTCYLLQIAALDVLGSNYGFGLRIRPLLTVPCALALFGLLVLFSAAWLSRFRIGPAEWLWRSFTYLRLDPIRHRPAGDPA